MNKKGDYKWSIVLSLILGLLVLGLGLFFIFNEYYTEEDSDVQICRQSIQVRALLPEASYADLTVHSFKDDFPLKCKTMVKTIEKEDVEEDGAREAKRIIAETMAECWALYGKGDVSAFPSGAFLLTSSCVPCARIHFTEEAKEAVRKSNAEISIRDSLDLSMDQGYTYYNFLMNSGDKFSAFGLAASNPFDLEGDGFFVNKTDYVSGTFVNRMGGTEEGISVDGIWNAIDVSKVSLPGVFDVEAGDLLINYGIITSPKEGGAGDYLPYLFYFQANQKLNPFDLVKEKFVDGVLWSNVNFCENWDGIPA